MDGEPGELALLFRGMHAVPRLLNGPGIIIPCRSADYLEGVCLRMRKAFFLVTNRQGVTDCRAGGY